MVSKRCTIRFWIRTDAPLGEIAEKLQKSRVISNFEIDYENVYEWFVAKPIDYDVELNVSRVHHDFKVPKNEPLHFILIENRISDSQFELAEWTYKIADAVCQALGQTVEIGEIDHLGDDVYQHHTLKTISPN